MGQNKRGERFEELIAADLEQLLSQLDQNSKEVDLLIEIGKRYRGSGKLSLAIEFYQRALEIVPTDPFAVLFMGSAKFAQGKYRSAKRYFEAALKILPDIACPYWCLADACAALGEEDRAESLYKQAVRIEPDDRDAKRYLERFLERRYGQFDDR